MSNAEFDRDHLWHPYTSMTSPLPAYQVERADGVTLTLDDGRQVIDGMSSWWCAIHGYNHPRLNDAVRTQLDKMSHVMFGGLTHAPAQDLGRQMLQLLPPELDRIFFADSGSVAVEVAIKMALQYWFAAGQTSRQKLLTVKGGYHGDTFGAMAVCDPEGGMHHLFTNALPQHLFCARPRPRFGEEALASDLDEARALIDAQGDTIAALIVEPVVQGAGGMWFYSADYLKQLVALCRQKGILVIFDEIATGFGRSGALFAMNHADLVPDIVCLGKALTGGYMTLAATVTSRAVAEGISSNDLPLMHGPTFMANPLACSVACASLQLLVENDWRSQVSALQGWLGSALEPLRERPWVSDVRVLGAIGVVQTTGPVNVAAIQAFFVDKGVWIRPFSDLIYLMPPYIMNQEHIERLAAAIDASLADDRFLQ